MNSIIENLTLSNTADLKVHDYANAFPMLPEDELQALADDIKAEGLHHPVVIMMIDDEPVLIDGRNRLAACRLNNLEPDFIEFDGDPAAYVYSENVTRRMLTVSQRAMAQAILQPKGQSGKRNDLTSGLKRGGSKEPSQAILERARAILRDDKSSVQNIIDGSDTVGAVYRAMKDRQIMKGVSGNKFNELKDKHPLMAEQVSTGKIKLETALEQIKEDAEARESELKGMIECFRKLRASITMISTPYLRERMMEAFKSEFYTEQTFNQLKTEISSDCENVNKLFEEIKNAD